jgi:hypothetical protein
MHVLDKEFLVLDAARHFGLQVRLLRQRIQAQHLQKLPAILPLLRIPVVQRLDLAQAGVADALRFDAEILGQHLVAAAGFDLGQLSFSRRFGILSPPV